MAPLRTNAVGVLAVLALTASAALAATKIPESWGTCKRSDPKFDECLRGAIQRAMTALEKGSSEFGIGPLDPFKVSQLSLEKGNGGALSMDMTLSEAEIIGFKNARVESVQTDMNKFKIVANMRTDKLDLNSLYKVTGRVLLIPINGNGKTTIKMQKPLLRLSMQGGLKKGADGNDHLHIESTTFEIIPEKANFRFVNPAHAVQADLLSRVVSENDKVIMTELQPAISQAFNKRLLEITNRIFDKVAFEDVFPQ
ncbi:Protein takeout [Frankliniella fusca]|uniref:Protein takeout n=1 Tax=Frankliniella fusca TaxID=407009 RepID=A0AAE1LFX1_9NEOP|nr:Protein takeout [Frankliniella fusca]